MCVCKLTNLKERFGYSVSRPSRCCWNCACCCTHFPSSHLSCSRLTAEKAANRAFGYDISPTEVSECGVCSKWVSKAVASEYIASRSLEEAKLRSTVVSDGSYTEELDNALCEKKATTRMLEYMAAIMSDPEMLSSRLPPAPFDALPYLDGSSPSINFRLSKAFWPVYEWLKASAPVYEKLMERRRARFKLGVDVLKNSMMHIDPARDPAV